MLGIALTDADVLNIPLLATDPYGRFVRGPNGFPQIVEPARRRARRGQPDDARSRHPLAQRTRRVKTGHAFLDDIAHHAVPKAGFDARPRRRRSRPGLPTCERPDVPTGCVDQYDDEMLDAHFIAGDGRVNENIGLTAVHHVFHSEHNRLVGEIDDDDRHADTGASPPPSEADWKRRTATRPRRRLGLRRAPVPGRPLRHRDGVPAPRLRGVHPQGPADGQPLRRGRHRLQHRASTRPSRPSSPTRSTASGTRCSPSRSTAISANGTRDDIDAARRVPQPTVVHGGRAGRRSRRPATSSAA